MVTLPLFSSPATNTFVHFVIGTKNMFFFTTFNGNIWKCCWKNSHVGTHLLIIDTTCCENFKFFKPPPPLTENIESSPYYMAKFIGRNGGNDLKNFSGSFTSESTYFVSFVTIGEEAYFIILKKIKNWKKTKFWRNHFS